MKSTALLQEHQALKAKLLPFGGWQMPISYSSVIKEHNWVRTACGIFDVSHMGEIFVEGEDALKFIQHMMINDAEKLADGEGQYTAMCQPDGGMIDDLIIYRLSQTRFLICANASNTEKDFVWLKKHTGDYDVELFDRSGDYAQLAVQGPKSLDALLPRVVSSDRARLKELAYTHIAELTLNVGSQAQAYVARTGYTGEKGYEVYLPNEFAGPLWRGLLEGENADVVKPIGLAARDTLRLEACYLLYGNDMDERVTPLEAGIGWATKLDKPFFIGHQALLKQKADGLDRRLVAFTMDEAGIPRADMEVFANNKLVGQVTSGSVLPSVGGAGGLAMIETSFSQIGQKLDVDVRGKRRLATIVKKPFYAAKVKS